MGVKRTSEEFNIEFLGEIPINSDVGKCGDEGMPIVEKFPDHNITIKYVELEEKIKKKYL